jgi:hypothetical protein
MTTTVSYGEGGFRMSWGAVFGGAVATLGLWLLLHTLGLAAGLSAIDPQDRGSLRGVGIGTGVWSVIAPLIALFVGGYVAAYTAGFFDRTTRVIHGVVVWGLTTLLGALLISMALAATVRAGVRTGAAAIEGAAAMAGGGSAMQALGVDADDLLAPVNQRLVREGAPPVRPDQLEAATRDVFQQSLQSGRLDRATLIQALTRNTGINESEAQQMAGRIEQQWNQKSQELQRFALTAADRTGKALWGVFLALLLGLVSAAAGALVGGGPRARERAVVERPVPVPPGPRHVPVETGT